MPNTAQCFDYMSSMRLSPNEVMEIGITSGQAENKLWLAMHNGRTTSSRFAEIMHRRPSTDPRRLIKDIMGYGEGITHLLPQIRWGRDESLAYKVLFGK